MKIWIAALLLSLSAFFTLLPEKGLATENKVTSAEMTAIKKAADEAVAEAKFLGEQAKTEEEKSLAEEQFEYAQTNAEVAADLLKTVQDGGNVDQKETEQCANITKAVNKATEAIAAGDVKKAGKMLNGIVEMEDELPERNGIIGKVTSIDRSRNIRY